MKKISHDVWIFPLPSGTEIHLRDVPQEDLDFLDSIEQKTARVTKLEEILRECRDIMDRENRIIPSVQFTKVITKIKAVLK